MRHHIMQFDYDEVYSDNVRQAMTALFDDRDLTTDEVPAIIREGVYDSRIITMTRNQFETVFRSLLNKEESQP